MWIRRTRAAARSAAARSPKLTVVDVRRGGGEPAHRILTPAAVLVDPGHRERVQRLHQQRPQPGHRPGQVAADLPGHAGRPEETVVGGALRHAGHVGRRRSARSARPRSRTVPRSRAIPSTTPYATARGRSGPHWESSYQPNYLLPAEPGTSGRPASIDVPLGRLEQAHRYIDAADHRRAESRAQRSATRITSVPRETAPAATPARADWPGMTHLRREGRAISLAITMCSQMITSGIDVPAAYKR